jgi:hypothetical protein
MNDPARRRKLNWLSPYRFRPKTSALSAFEWWWKPTPEPR